MNLTGKGFIEKGVEKIIFFTTTSIKILTLVLFTYLPANLLACPTFYLVESIIRMLIILKSYDAGHSRAGGNLEKFAQCWMLSSPADI